MQITGHDNGIVLLDWGDGTLGAVDGAFTMVTREGPGMTIYGQEGVISSTGRAGNFRLYQRSEGGRYPRGWSEVDSDGNVVATGNDAGAVAAFNTVYGQVPGELAPKLALAVACERNGDHSIAESLYRVCATTDAAYTAPAAFGLAAAMTSPKCGRTAEP